jgi:guanylate kinase
LIVVFIGPGGVGKGTLATRLVAEDPRLWLSRSWTTRARREGEAADAYTFVDRPAFVARAEAGGFLEWAEFLGDLYGTPWPEIPEGRDLVLEIDVQGAAQVRERHPDAVVILLVAPDAATHEARLRARGDAEAGVRRRLAIAADEIEAGRALADHTVVNDDLDQAVAEVAALLEAHRQ